MTAASIPRESLAGLAALRVGSGIEVALVDDLAWLRWPADDQAAVVTVLALPGAVLYAQRAGRWFRHGSFLPFFDFPEGLEYRPLHELVFPDRARPIAAVGTGGAARTFALVADQQPRTVSAVLCPLEEVRAWADSVPSQRLAALRGVCRGSEIFLVGRRLPLFPGGQRFWGTTVFVPLGYRLNPNWPESAIRTALGAEQGDLLLASSDGFETIRRDLLRMLTRYGLRVTESHSNPTA